MSASIAVCPTNCALHSFLFLVFFNDVTLFCSGLAPPEVLLKNYRRQAREFANMGDERAVYDRVRCVALTRIIYGDNHWKLAKAYSKLSQAYLEIRGRYI